MKYFAVIMLVFWIMGCGRQQKPQTQFARDYAELQPKIKRCEDYYDLSRMKEAVKCINDLAALANKTVLESNDGDDSSGSQNIAANLMSARINNLESQIIIWQINQMPRH